MNKDVTAHRSGEIHPAMSQLKRITRVFLKRKLAIIGLVVVLFVTLVAICAPLLAPYNPYKVDVIHKLQNPSLQHLLGTDTLGRDIALPHYLRLANIAYGRFVCYSHSRDNRSTPGTD